MTMVSVDNFFFHKIDCLIIKILLSVTKINKVIVFSNF